MKSYVKFLSIIFLFFLVNKIQAQYNNVSYDYTAGNGDLGDKNSSFGYNAGSYLNSSSRLNTYIGYYAGKYTTSGNSNTFIGAESGCNVTTGYNNSIVGWAAGNRLTTGTNNIFIGWKAGLLSTTSSLNVFIGSQAGLYNRVGTKNVYLGYASGFNSTGSENVFIGYKSGQNEEGSNKLYIENSSSSTPLVYGDFSEDLLTVNGRMGIGTTNVDTTLALKVNGTIKAKEVLISLSGFPDYVFSPDYNLRSLGEVETYIKTNSHLPDIPSEAEVIEHGISLGEMDAKLLQKIEELTLYMLEINKEVKELKDVNKKLLHEVADLRTQIK